MSIAYDTAKVSAGDLFVNEDKTLGYVWNNPYTEGVFVGHRWYESKNIPVRFPFGFGLSYTTFAYEDLKAEIHGKTVKLSFQLRNTGKRPGAEVAQIYISDKQCSVPRPPQELKAFQKVRLEPGKSQRVQIELGPEAFRFWNPATKQWTIEPGEFEIRVSFCFHRWPACVRQTRRSRRHPQTASRKSPMNAPGKHANRASFRSPLSFRIRCCLGRRTPSRSSPWTNSTPLPS